jgi:hypothetical protein
MQRSVVIGPARRGGAKAWWPRLPAPFQPASSGPALYWQDRGRVAAKCVLAAMAAWAPAVAAGPPAGCWPPEGDSAVIREELSRLFTPEERHRRLFARLLIAFGMSMVVFAVGTVLIWVFESGQKGGSIHGFGDAAFFCSVQLLTVSSSMTNPVTPVGKIVDVGLEAWAIFVVTAVAGSFATFFSSGDTS